MSGVTTRRAGGWDKPPAPGRRNLPPIQCIHCDAPIRGHATCPNAPTDTAPKGTPMTAQADDFLGLNEPDRDWMGRPLIIPEGGGKPVPYQRVSTFASTLSDAGGLLTWGKRMAALGVARHEDLAAMIASLTFSDLDDDKKRKAADKPVNKILDGHIETAICRVTDAAAYGTAVHSFTEPDASPFVPARMQADVASYQRALDAHGITVCETELFVVHDALGVAGTLDHIYDVPGFGRVVADKKTGTKKPQELALQLRAYAGAARYNVETGERTPLDVSQEVAVLVHIPRGQGETVLYLVDLLEAERACAAAVWVREWRKRDDLLSHLTPLSAAS